MGKLQAFSAGVMIFMSLFDLVPESIASIGSFVTAVCFALGVVATYLLDRFVVPNVGNDQEGLLSNTAGYFLGGMKEDAVVKMEHRITSTLDDDSGLTR